MIEVDDKTALMDRKAFDDLLDYSCSMPTGAFVGKRWKRGECACCTPFRKHNGQMAVRRSYGTCEEHNLWLMGEYIQDADPEYVCVKWREILIA